MKGRSTLLARLAPALALALALAGCLHAPAPPAGLPVGEDGRSLPTLHGVVVDAGIHPLPGALVRFLGTDGDVGATTDEEGRYEIRRPTAQAASVLVSASLPGFLPRTQQVQVSGHVSAKMDFVLEGDASAVPHVDVLKASGLAACNAIVVAGGQRLGSDCADDEAYYNVEGETTEAPRSIWDLTPTPGLAGAVVEVHWVAATPASSTLHARLRAPLVGGQPAEVQAEATGESPLRLEIPADVARSFPRWTAIRLYVELATQDGSAAPVAAANDQSFDAFATLFYVDPAPAGYTLG